MTHDNKNNKNPNYKAYSRFDLAAFMDIYEDLYLVSNLITPYLKDSLVTSGLEEDALKNSYNSIKELNGNLARFSVDFKTLKRPLEELTVQERRIDRSPFTVNLRNDFLIFLTESSTIIYYFKNIEPMELDEAASNVKDDIQFLASRLLEMEAYIDEHSIPFDQRLNDDDLSYLSQVAQWHDFKIDQPTHNGGNTIKNLTDTNGLNMN